MKTSKTLRDDLQKLAVGGRIYINFDETAVHKVGEDMYEVEDIDGVYPYEGLDEVLWTVENLL